MPQRERVRKANRRVGKYPSPEWARTRVHGEEFNADLRRNLANSLHEAIYPAIAPMLAPNWTWLKATGGDLPFKSNTRYVGSKAVPFLSSSTIRLTNYLPTDHRHPHIMYTIATNLAEQADNCQECGECEEACSQGIEIVQELKKAHEVLVEPPKQ